MTALIVFLGALAAIMLIAEILEKKKWLNGELRRKFVHITSSTLAAFSPFFLSYRTIQIVCAAAIVFILVGRYSGLIKSLYSVDRLSWGEILGPAVCIVIAAYEPDPWIFCAAGLHVALADGFAAIVGTTYGKKNSYKVFGQTKSIAGTLAFYVTSLLITIAVMALDTNTFVSPLLIVLLLPPIATAIENVGVYGTDNLLVPLTVVVFLSYFQAAA